MIYHEQLTVSGVSGTVYSTRPAVGFLEYIKVLYTNGDAGGDVTITDDEEGTALLTLANNNTDKASPILVQVMGTTGSAIAATYSRIPLTSRIKMVVAQEAANSTVVADVWWSDV